MKMSGNERISSDGGRNKSGKVDAFDLPKGAGWKGKMEMKRQVMVELPQRKLISF